MARRHLFIFSLLLGLAAVAGTTAALRTVRVGRAATSKPAVSYSSIVRRERALNRVEASLHAALVRRPPKLPKIPSYPAVAPAAAPAPSVAAAAPAPAVQYVRPAPIVIVKHHPHGDDGQEQDGGGGGGDD